MSGAETSGVAGRFSGTLGGFRLEAEFALPGRGLTALSGPSGSGKTTLLRCIAGLTRLSGELTVAGEAWQDARSFRPAHRRPVGMVFQEASLLPHLSVRRNLEFGWRRAQGPRTIAWDEAVELLSLAPLLSRAPDELSGGERQRVAVGRALLSQPRLLLMDEPLSSLDAESKAEILPYLDRLHRSLAIPALYVSHDPAEIARLADRVLLMRDGRVSPAEAPPRPADLTAARARLAAMTPEERERHALAAIVAGLTPSD
ncbi:molybdenum ABC transporter ATP-binding protein [Phenylobacterium sp.]|uniref:molybdenum ABC transporter ATP-binding protein n=1 Tax=Phenylobacterium sp. TaxID=1871053 RepID=UPI002F3F234B